MSKETFDKLTLNNSKYYYVTYQKKRPPQIAFMYEKGINILKKNKTIKFKLRPNISAIKFKNIISITEDKLCRFRLH